MNTTVTPAAGQAGPDADNVDPKSSVSLATRAMAGDTEAANELAFKPRILPVWLERELQGNYDGMTDAERAQHAEEEREKAVREETEAFNREFTSYENSRERYETTYESFMQKMNDYHRATEEAEEELKEQEDELERRRKNLDNQTLDDGTKLHRDDKGIWHTDDGNEATEAQTREANLKREQESKELDEEAARLQKRKQELDEFKAREEKLVKDAQDQKKRFDEIDAEDRALQEKIRKGEITDPEEIRRAREKIANDRAALDQESNRLKLEQQRLEQDAPDIVKQKLQADMAASTPSASSEVKSQIAAAPKLISTEDEDDDDEAPATTVSKTFASADGQGIQASISAKNTFNGVSQQTTVAAITSDQDGPSNAVANNRDKSQVMTPV